METPLIKKCPFCGSDPTIEKNYIKCTACGIRTAKYLYQRFALQAWNKRIKNE